MLYVWRPSFEDEAWEIVYARSLGDLIVSQYSGDVQAGGGVAAHVLTAPIVVRSKNIL